MLKILTLFENTYVQRTIIVPSSSNDWSLNGFMNSTTHKAETFGIVSFSSAAFVFRRLLTGFENDSIIITIVELHAVSRRQALVAISKN